MRIISGKWRSRSLTYPKNKSFRPTQDRVREAIFSKVLPVIEEASVLDLCCGTGAFGLEALSRGARFSTFVDIQTQTVKKNIAQLDCCEQTKVVTQRAPVFLNRLSERVDLIFLDPPWNETEIYVNSLKAIYENDILTDDGQLVVEYRASSPPTVLDFSGVSTYGDTAVTILSRPLLKTWAETVLKNEGST